MSNILKNGWNDVLGEEFNKDYYKKLRTILINEYNTHTIYPDKYDILMLFIIQILKMLKLLF